MSFGQIGSWALTAGKIAVATRLIHSVSPCVPGYVVAAGHIVVPACIDAVRNAIAGSDAVDDSSDNSSWESPTNNTTDISENNAIYGAPSGPSETDTERTCNNCQCTTEDDQEIYYDAEDGTTGCSKRKYFI